MNDSVCFQSAVELTTDVRRGHRSPVDIIEAFLSRIDTRAKTNAYITITADAARQKAREAEQAVETGEDLGPLHGVPLALKDLISFKTGVRHTFGATPFEDFVPSTDAAFVERLEDAGAIVLGKTNTPAFGHKGITDNDIIGATPTPFDPTKNAGGSSGGSAAAVADGLTVLATGSDGGGSIRKPAANCNVVGLKPSFGRVPIVHRPDAFSHYSHSYGLHAGPITRTVEDAALMLEVMSGPHPRDPLSLPEDSTSYVGITRQGVQGMDIAYSPDLGVFTVDESVQSVVREGVRAFESGGATVEEIPLEFEWSHEQLWDAWSRGSAMNKANFAETFKDAYDIDLLGDHRDELEDSYIRLLEDGYDLSAMEYKNKDFIHTELFDAVQDVFMEFDLLVTPTVAEPPHSNAYTGSSMDWNMAYPINMTGHPAASVPAGLNDDGLPIGMQVIGGLRRDDDVLRAAGALERLRPWHQLYPREN